MGIISKGIVITKTIRNVNRMREIVTVFAKNGFDEFMSMGITSRIPNFVLPKSKTPIKDELSKKQDGEWPRILGHRLRLCFEELGPTFVKFGQLLSSREDVFDQAFINELKELRDNVKPLPFDQVKECVEKSLGGPLEQFFQHFDPTPLGTASIGVVHAAQLKSGEDVVVKVRRPAMAKAIETDFSILLFIMGQIEKVSEDIRRIGPTRILKDFEITLQNELNFHIEANNGEKIKTNMKGHDSEGIFYLPKIYKELVREDILVMERVRGIAFSSNEIVKQAEVLTPKLELGLQVFIKTFLQDGFFHADLHGGNFFLMDNGQIGIIDFGLVGTLSKKARQNFLAIIYALLTYNYENLVYEFLDVAEYDGPPDVELLIRDVRDVLAPFVGLTVKQMNFSFILQSVIGTLTRHKLYLPREWFVVFRAFITLDGVGRSLDIDFDIFGLFEKDIHSIIKNNVNKDELLEEAIWAARDILPIARTFPRHMRWFVREWAKKNYSFEIRHVGHEEAVNKVSSSLVFLSLTVMASVCLACGVFLLGNRMINHVIDIPHITWIFWGASGLLFLRGLSYIKK